MNIDCIFPKTIHCREALSEFGSVSYYSEIGGRSDTTYEEKLECDPLPVSSHADLIYGCPDYLYQLHRILDIANSSTIIAVAHPRILEADIVKAAKAGDYLCSKLVLSSLTFEVPVNEIWTIYIFTKGRQFNCEVPKLQPTQPTIADSIWDLRDRVRNPEFGTFDYSPFVPRNEVKDFPPGFTSQLLSNYYSHQISFNGYRPSWSMPISHLVNSVDILLHPYLPRAMSFGEMQFVFGWDELPESLQEVRTTPPPDMLRWLIREATKTYYINESISFFDGKFHVVDEFGTFKEYCLASYIPQNKSANHLPLECQEQIKTLLQVWRQYVNL